MATILWLGGKSQAISCARDGTTHVIFELLDFIAQLAALVPKPRVNLTRFHGVFAARIDISRPSRAVPVTLPGIRVSYHGGSMVLSVGSVGDTRKTSGVEIRVA